LTELYVRPERRGDGLGREILGAAVELARENGVHSLHLQVRPENRAARALYERLGFITSPRLVMSKKL
jgi:ribosomal-protein-alanine N-acetyltransferase